MTFCFRQDEQLVTVVTDSFKCSRYCLVVIDFDYQVTKLANFRDLGGIGVTGGELKPSTLFRSDDLATIDHEEAERVAGHGLKLIIDFRSKPEAESTGRGPLGDHEISYLNLPLLDLAQQDHDIGQRIEQMSFTNQMLGSWYAMVLEQAAPMVVEGLWAIAQTDGPAVFHCAIGKDRTGIFAASALSLMGANREAIVADFAKTQERLPQILARLSHSQPFWTPEIMVKSGALVRAEAEAMQAMFDVLDQKGLGITELLQSAGANSELVEKLTSKHLAN